MFEDALLESSPRRASVLRRNHYLYSALVGTLFLALGMYLLPWFVTPASERALITLAVMLGTVAALHSLLLCYVWLDAREHHLPAWPWVLSTLLLSLPGMMIYLVYAAVKSGDWKRAAIPLAYMVESIIVGAMVLLPLIYTQALPRDLLITEVHYFPASSRPPAPAQGRPVTARHQSAVNPFQAPPRIPDRIVRIVEAPDLPPQGPISDVPFIPGVPDGIGGSDGAGVIGSPFGNTPPPPAPVVHAAPKPPVMVRQSKGTTAAKGIFQPKPIYPRMAVIARIQGTVVLQAVIGRDGTIQGLKVVSGNPWLAQAAIEAVKTWRYQPTLLNDEAVDVLTEIDVNFTLGE